MLIPCCSRIVWMEVVHHPLDGTEIDPRFGVFFVPRVFFAQDARPSQPGEGPLHHPPARQDFKGMLIRLFMDHLQRHPVGLFDGVQQPAVAAINPEFGHRRTAFSQQGHHIPGAIAITDVGGVDDDREEIALRVNGDVAFAPRHLFFPHRSRARRPIRWFWWIDCRDSQPLARPRGQWPGGPGGAGRH